MVETLGSEEREKAARSSYSYYEASIHESTSLSHLNEHRTRMAMRMARRHLVAENKNEAKALDKMKNTLRFREEMRIDDIRTCFKGVKEEMGSDQSLSDFRNVIELDVLKTEAMLVRGYDNEGRSILLKFNRSKFTLNEKDFFTVQLYWIERALACTERRSCGVEEKMDMVVNYDGYCRENKPPMGLVKQLVHMLQEHYPERLHFWIAVDPPFLLRTIWRVVSVFIDPKTKQKVKFITGTQQKQIQIGPHISKDQAMPFLLPGGLLTSPLDMKHYLHNVPFQYDHDGN